jgi:hypothetical protein
MPIRTTTLADARLGLEGEKRASASSMAASLAMSQVMSARIERPFDFCAGAALVSPSDD